MATLDLWRLPAGVGAAFLTAEHNGVVAFSDGADALAQIELATGAVRRWGIPAALHGSTIGSAGATAIVRDPAGRLWCALTGGARLLALDPASGTMASHAHGGPGTADPLGYPLRVRIDAAGEVWFAGLALQPGVVAGPVIGRLSGGGMTSWVLPNLASLRVSDIWLQEMPRLVWFTLQLWNHHAVPGGAIPVLGCLDPATGDVTLWSRAPQPPAGAFHFTFGCVSLTGNSATSPKLIWATSQSSYAPSSVLAFEIAAGTAREFAPPTPGFLNAIDVDGVARPWVAALGGARITRIASLSCGVAIPLLSRKLVVRPVAGEVKRSEARVRVRRAAAPRLRRRLRPRTTRCFAEFGLNAVVPYDTVVAKAGAVDVLFTAPALAAIGRLLP